MDEEYSMHQEHEFFYICGHGSLSLDEHYNDNEIKMPDCVVYTFAPPGATCSLPPETITNLREKLHEMKETYHNSKEFWKKVLDAEYAIRGMNYCSQEWVGFFAKKEGYSATKACNVQRDKITQKTYTFEDKTLQFGIWNLKTNENYINYLDKEMHNLENICQFLKQVFPNKIITILDLTCSSPLSFDRTEYIENVRQQRRLARRTRLASQYTHAISNKRDKKVRIKSNKKQVGKIQRSNSANSTKNKRNKRKTQSLTYSPK